MFGGAFTKGSLLPLRRCTSASRRKPPITPFIPPIITIFAFTIVIHCAFLFAVLKGLEHIKGAVALQMSFMTMLMMVIAIGLIKATALIYLVKVVFMVLYLVILVVTLMPMPSWLPA